MKQLDLKDGEMKLYPNNYKTQDNHPDKTGQYLKDGVRYKAACWNRKAKSGLEYLYIKTEVQMEAEEPGF